MPHFAMLGFGSAAFTLGLLTHHTWFVFANRRFGRCTLAHRAASIFAAIAIPVFAARAAITRFATFALLTAGHFPVHVR